MIYEVYLDEKLLYYPNDEEAVILNSALQLALNEAGSFEFDIPPYNPRYNDFKLRKSMLQVLENGKEIFYGEVREVKTNSDFTKHVYAVGELAFLFDSIQGQARYLTSPYDAMQSIIAKHNSQVEDRKKYVLSEVSVTDSDNQIYFYTNGEDTLSIIRDKICSTLEGYIRVTKSGNTRYIGIVPLSRFGTSEQEIQFGENLLDYSCNLSASDIATCVVPRGAKIDDENRTENAVQGLDEYTTIVGTPADAYHKNVKDDFVQLDGAVSAFGYVRVVKNWDNVTVPANLKKKAIEWLQSAQYESMTLELKAVDMALFDVNINTIKLGETVRVTATPYGMDTTIPVHKKTIYLQDIDRNEIVLGNTVKQSFTKQASNAVSLLQDEIPEESNILKQAKQNAVIMLSDPTQGYVSYVFDENGNRTAIEITDSKDSTKATRKWVWNSSGLGYLYIKDGKWVTDIAMTMDGAFVADRVTTGVMSGDRVGGGTILVGGSGYGKDGSIVVKSASDGQLVKIDKNGLDMDAGSITLGSNFSVDTSGNMKASNVDITGKIKATEGEFTGDIKSGSKVSGATIEGGSITIGDNFSVDTDGKLTATGAHIEGDIDITGDFSGNVVNGATINCGTKFSVDVEGNMTASNADITGKVTSTQGSIGGFTIGSNNLHVGSNESNGIWIFGGDHQGSPNGSVVVGTHGAGLIRIGYKHGDKIGILWEANSSERYFVNLYDIGTKI